MKYYLNELEYYYIIDDDCADGEDDRVISLLPEEIQQLKGDNNFYEKVFEYFEYLQAVSEEVTYVDMDKAYQSVETVFYHKILGKYFMFDRFKSNCFTAEEEFENEAVAGRIECKEVVKKDRMKLVTTYEYVE